MTRDQLEHAIRAACDVAGDTELLVFGSQAILGQYQEAPASLRASIEVDVQPLNKPAQVDAIDGALGELSQFHQTFGFYVHGVSIESVLLPAGWETRTIVVSDSVATRGHVGRCLEAHDLAASKLAAYREKDRDFVRTLLAEQLVDHRVLLERLEQLDIEEDHREQLKRWVSSTTRDLTS